MTWVKKILSAAMVLTSMAALARGGDVGVDISSGVIASGLSSADTVVVISGYFHGSCYEWNRAIVTDVSPQLHEVRAVATQNMGACSGEWVPYSEEVSLGRLCPGAHVVRLVNPDGSYSEKTVRVGQ